MNFRQIYLFINLSLILFLTADCTLNRHTIPPYKNNREASDELQKKSGEACLLRKESVPEKPMFTDGCSAWPDGKKRACCVEHDIHYWCGGTKAERKKADEEFRSCVKRETGPVNAFIVYSGVRLGGSPKFPFRWRWGYGYKYLKKHNYDRKEKGDSDSAE